MKFLDKFNITVSDTLSLLALVISGVAAYFTIQADFRSQNTDRQVSLVVMESIGDKLKRYAENANSSYRVLRAYREMAFEYPEKQVTSEKLSLEYLEKQSTRDVSFSEDLLLSLAKSESETAQKIARCYSLYESTVNDAKQFSGITPETLTIPQHMTLAVMLSRFKKVSDACEDADKSLSLHISSHAPLRGTLSELEEAQVLVLEGMVHPDSGKRIVSSLNGHEGH